MAAVAGAVVLSGKVVDHERGYRAERAAVLAVALFAWDLMICSSDPAWLEGFFVDPQEVLRTPPSGWLDAALTIGGDERDAVVYLKNQTRRYLESWTSVS